MSVSVLYYNSTTPIIKQQKFWWDGLDSNQLRFYVPDLQSGAHPPSEQPSLKLVAGYSFQRQSDALTDSGLTGQHIKANFSRCITIS